MEIKENNLKTTKEINVEEILHSETPFAAVLMDGKKKYDCFFREIKVKKKMLSLTMKNIFFNYISQNAFDHQSSVLKNVSKFDQNSKKVTF